MSQLFGGGSSQSNFNTNPLNLQNPAFQQLAPAVAGSLAGIFGGGPAFSGIGSAFGPNVNTPNAGIGASNNPLVAGLTPQQLQLVGQAGGQAQPTAQQGQAGDVLSRTLSPSFTDTASNPNVQRAVQAAVNPIQFSFANSTLPSIISQFTQAGQATPTSGNFAPGGNPAGAGNPVAGGGATDSSAFQKAAGIAQTGEAQAEATAASNIELPAYEQATAQQQAAVGQAAAIPAQLISNTINALQASALPQMIAQYGINQALQLFQQRVQTMMTALGLGGQVAQPALAEQGTGGATGTTNPDLVSGFGNVATGAANLIKANNTAGNPIGQIFNGLFGSGGGGASLGPAGAIVGGASDLGIPGLF